MCFYDVLFYIFFFKQKTAYEMRISDWSSDVCSSDLKIADSSAARVGGLRRSRVPEGSIADWPLQHDSARQEPRAFFVWKIGIGGVELAAHRDRKSVV